MNESEKVHTPDEQPFAKALGTAISQQKLTLAEISARLKAAGLPTSVATLSYWQNGRTVPTRGRSRDAVGVLESILGLEPGTLLGRLPGHNRSEWTTPPSTTGDVDLNAVLAEWRLTLGDMHTHRAIQETWRVSDGSRRIVETSRAVSQVKAEQQSAFPIVLRDEEDTSPMPSMRCVHGCRLGRSLEAHEKGLYVGEVLLPRTYRHGETYWTELEIDWGASDVVRRNAACGVSTSLSVLTLDLEFEDSAPSEVTFGRQFVDTDEKILQTLPTKDSAVRVAMTVPSAGSYWFSW